MDHSERALHFLKKADEALLISQRSTTLEAKVAFEDLAVLYEMLAEEEEQLAAREASTAQAYEAAEGDPSAVATSPLVEAAE
jgi:hypothetical protein